MNTEVKEKTHVKIDFKMITFSLSGKDYGIDIMKVKEISKEKKFTFVPNTPPYVHGVFNLRGDIIPIIDLREMFFLPVEKKDEEELIILRLDDMIIGTIVDKIDMVLGVSSEDVQPTHPIFSDINVKYMHGVVEYNDRLYIILDVDRIFKEDFGQQEITHPEIPQERKVKTAEKDPTFSFIIETLKTFKSFYVTDINRKWIEGRFREWQNLRRSEGKEVQFQGHEDAEIFLKSFFSSYTDLLWGEDYKENILELMPEKIESFFNVWNPGCGKGLESFSIAAILKIKYPMSRIKVWANDIDLISISAAPGIILSEQEIPNYMKENGFVKEQLKGYSFVESIKDCITFEYHDILHRNEYPGADCIIARDVLSFMESAQQKRLIQEFRDKLKDDGLLILGVNEIIPDEGWFRIEEGNVAGYRKDKS